uniref:Saposin B-type domain-containing protein n=1 Tax=Steinernema glaseri TaxID=37863 RepID=A0A1I8A8D7_9BILA
MLAKAILIALLASTLTYAYRGPDYRGPHWPNFCLLCAKIIDNAKADVLQGRSVDDFRNSLTAQCDKYANGIYGHLCLSIVSEDAALWYRRIEQELKSIFICLDSRFCN